MKDELMIEVKSDEIVIPNELYDELGDWAKAFEELARQMQRIIDSEKSRIEIWIYLDDGTWEVVGYKSNGEFVSIIPNKDIEEVGKYIRFARFTADYLETDQGQDQTLEVEP